MYLLLTLVFSGILVVVYAVTLSKVIQEGGYKVIVMMTVMLLVSNVTNMLNAISDERILYLQNGGFYDAELFMWDWFSGITLSLTDLLFCEAHWIFACYYFKVATQNPIIIKSVQVP